MWTELSDPAILQKLWGQLVGSLVWDSTMDMAYYEYDSRFRQNGLELAPRLWCQREPYLRDRKESFV